MKQKHVKNLILGGGISGLSLAYFLKKDYFIVEAEDHVGGFCKTIRRNGYVWDYAGHFFHFQNPEIQNMFLNYLSENETVYQEKCTKIWYHDQLIDYPFQKNIHQLEKQEFIDCLYDLYFKQEKKQYTDFLDMLYGKFGNSIVEKFLKPYNEKLYACNLSSLDVDAMGRFFPYANLSDIIQNMKNTNNHSYNDHFMYPLKGAQVFIDILYQSLDKDLIALNTKVIKINEKEKYVLLDNQLQIYYDNLINTIPLNTFINLTDNEKMIRFSQQLSFNKVLVFNLGFDKKSKFTQEHWIYVPEKKYNFYRIGFYDNILNADRLSMYIEIGLSKDEIPDVQKQLDLTLKNLLDMGIIQSDFQLVDYETIIMSPAYVHINHKDEEIINDYFNQCEQQNIYFIGRYGSWCYCSMEDCILMAQKLAKKLN